MISVIMSSDKYGLLKRYHSLSLQKSHSPASKPTPFDRAQRTLQNGFVADSHELGQWCIQGKKCP